MRVIDPGHTYELNHLDGTGKTILRFVMREGENFPGNVGTQEGPIIQEVLRAVIDRLLYVDKQKHFAENDKALSCLRWAFFWLEERAKQVRGEALSFGVSFTEHIERIPACRECGHIECTKHIPEIGD